MKTQLSMYMRLYLIVFIITVFASSTAVYADSAKTKYEEALAMTKNEEYDSALMCFRSIRREFPETLYARESLFGIGEYNFKNKLYGDSVDAFDEYVKSYPDSTGAIVAKAILLKIMRNKKKKTADIKKMIKDIVDSFFAKPLMILFSDHKEVEYISPLHNRYLMRHYLDRIEVYKNGRLFIEINQ